MRPHFVVAIGLSLVPEDRHSDEILARGLDDLLLVTDKALATFDQQHRDLLVSVGAYGPMLAFPDPDITRTRRFLAALSDLALRNNMVLKGALAWGALRHTHARRNLRPNFEGEPAVTVARLLARTKPAALVLHESAVEYWSPKRSLSNAQRLALPGKHAAESYWATILHGFFAAETSDTDQASDGPELGNKLPASIVKIEASATPTPRYLRRRCRALAVTSEDVRSLSATLLTERPSADDRARSLTIIRNLEDTFSATIARAIFYESTGNIEQMLTELQAVQFKGIQECCRRLYCAVALDKLDRCEQALEELSYVLFQAPHGSELIPAAQFNAAVCNEKLGKFDLVNAERFLRDRDFLFSTGEKLWHKALSLELIVCTRTRTTFANDDLVKMALAEEYPDSPKGFVKTLLNWHIYTGEPLSRESIERILELESRMTATARAGILGQLLRTMPTGPETQNVDELLQQLAKQSESYAIGKWLNQPK